MYLWLEVAVDDPVMTHEDQRLQHLTGEPPNEPCREPDKAVRLDKLVEVYAQELHRNAQMTAEVEVFSHLDDMVLLLSVLSTRQQEGRSCA